MAHNPAGQYGHGGGTGPRMLTHPYWIMMSTTSQLQAGG